MDIKLITATHKPYRMPADKMYLPVQAGSAGKESIGYTRDDTGDNTSEKNKHYCELTALYWAWKNLDADYTGLVHYRRHFTAKGAKGDKFDRIITKPQLEQVLSKTDIIVPIPRNYVIETNYSQYAHAHHPEDLDTTRAIIAEKYPAYIAAFDKSMKSTVGHRFNMFIMKQDKFNAYCGWLFDILFELESRLDISGYSDYDARVFGFVSERLLDVWLDTNGYSYVEQPYIFMESQNWLIKGFNFIKRKFTAKES